MLMGFVKLSSRGVKMKMLYFAGVLLFSALIFLLVSSGTSFYLVMLVLSLSVALTFLGTIIGLEYTDELLAECRKEMRNYD